MPTLQGPVAHPFVGDKLTTTNGSWSGSPTTYTYQWQRCDAVGDRQNCVAITGAVSQSYTVTKDDVNHTLDAVVTATNADGSASKDTKATGVVAEATAPVNKSRPTISGSAIVGSTLTAANGTWTGAVTFTYQWQACDSNGNNCADIVGATGRTYGVRSSDIGRELRVRVRASNRFGGTTATSDFTSVVADNTSTTVVTTTVQGPQPPAISFLSLKRVGTKLYARFRVCHNGGRVTVTERDNKAKTLAYTRHFAVSPAGCATYARSWFLIKRFRSPAGRVVVTLRASDNGGRLSRLVSRSVFVR
ncbi:MAG TPA: hypothetical protein VGN27_08915 [Gaiellaceae bacterium]|nr:hypothetical protein [Gaiellaceae bacterium]